MAMNTYFDFAENDYQWFIYSYKNHFIANGMAAQAQEICEKYLKHIIDTYHEPTQSQTEEVELEKTMHSHNLIKLMRYIKDHTEFTLLPETRQNLQMINGYYFIARYPGDESVEITKDDIELCYQAVETCRDNVLELLREAEASKYNEAENDMER